jgi:transcriptional regulator with XRE-family HTH domain
VESWERGRRNPKVEVLPELATLLSVTVDYLVGTDDLSQDIASARRTIELAAGRDPLEELLTVWQAIKHRPEMQSFILELAQEDPETIQRVLTALRLLLPGR